METKKKPFYKRWWFIVIVVLGVIGALGGDGDNEKEKDVAVKGDNEVLEQASNQKEEKKIDGELDITGKLNIEFEDDKAIAIVTTNAVDGSIFEVLLMDGEFNFVSDFVPVENGKIIREFEIMEEWQIGYIGGTALMSFYSEEHPQPEHVKELYGENGENLKGEFAVESDLGGKSIGLDSVQAAYPDEETVKATQDELLLEVLNELINASEGVIINIQPHFTDGDWSSVAVTVSDVWYDSQEHEKERFAEQISDTVITVIKNTGKVEASKTVSVYFYDAYQKELASPKIMGGYKIKR